MDSSHDMLSGLLEYAQASHASHNIGLNPPSRVDASPTGHPKTLEKNALYCGFCPRGQYYSHQSSLDRHIRDCARDNGYEARYWRAAGWKPEQLDHGFIWEGDVPRVKPGRICPHCHKVFRNTFEIAKHLSKLADGGKARALFDRSFQSPGNNMCAPVKKVLPSSEGNMKADHAIDESVNPSDPTQLCGFCNHRLVARNENRMDQHTQRCAGKHNYIARYWEPAGWLPGTSHGKGLIFKGEIAKVNPNRICSGCKLVFKNDTGMERHRKHTCTDVPESAEKARGTPTAQAPTAPKKQRRDSPPPAPSPRPTPSMTNSAIMPPERSIEQLERRVNQTPSHEVTELLIRLARSNKDARAIPNAQLLPRRGQFTQNGTEPPNKVLHTEPRRPSAQVQVGAERAPPRPAPGAESATFARPPPSKSAEPPLSTAQETYQTNSQEDWNVFVPYQICDRCNLKFDPNTNDPSRCARHSGVKRVRAQGDPVGWAEYNDPKLQARFYWACCGRSGDGVGCVRCAHEPGIGKKRKAGESRESMPSG